MAVPPLFRALFGRVPEMHPLTLRFLDPVMEARFRARYIDDNLSFIRVAVGLGIAVWVVFGLLAGLVLEGDDRTADLVLRYGFAVPLGVIGLVATRAPWYRRWWYVVIGVVVALSAWSGRCTGSSSRRHRRDGPTRGS